MKETPSLTPIHVLMVEDSQDDAELILLHLKRDGFRVECQRVQTEADYTAALSAEYDVILSDWSLPQFSGLRALELVREHSLETPFIIISGRIGEDAAVAALRLGAYDYLLKDRPDRLGQAVRNALEQNKYRKERKQAEELLQLQSSALNAAANAIVITDRDGNIQWFNPAFGLLTGYTTDEASGKNPRDLSKSGKHDREFYQHMWNTILAGQVWHGEIINRRKDGSEYYEELTITPLRGADGQIERFIAIKQDISARKQSELELMKRNKEIKFLYEASQQLSRTLDLDSLYTTLYLYLSEMMDCMGLFISTYDPVKKFIHCQFAIGEGKRLEVRDFPEIPLEAEGQGTQSRVIHSHKPLILNDYQSVVRSAQNSHYIGDNGEVVEMEHIPEDADIQRSAIILPILLEKGVAGVVQIFSYRVNAYTEDHLKIAEALVSQLAVASNNALLYQQAQIEIGKNKRAEDALRVAYDATLEGWANALELRERETAGHSRRVVEFTLKLARAMGIPDEEMTHIERGALMHDIGKIGIPDAILNKKGPLDAEEWENIRQHPVYAYNLLKKIPYLEPALTIPYRHHERWNGSGYPEGLKGEEIPIEARIFAVVDVWDALSYDRPYRAAWSEAVVLAYLEEQVGIQFDPRVVAAFQDVLKKSKAA